MVGHSSIEVDDRRVGERTTISKDDSLYHDLLIEGDLFEKLKGEDVGAIPTAHLEPAGA